MIIIIIIIIIMVIGPFGRLVSTLPTIKAQFASKNKGPSTMNCRGRGSHTQGMLSHTGYLALWGNRGETGRKSRHVDYSKGGEK